MEVEANPPGKRPGPERKSAQRKRRRGGRGVLWIIATALVLSGVLRLGGESGRAIASGVTDVISVSPAGGLQPQVCPTPPDVAAVLALLEEREARLAEREAALSDRLQALAVAEDQITRNMAKLEETERSLEATMALAASAAQDDIARLTAVYENMKPKESVPLFAAMDPQFAAGFLGQMRADVAAAILAGLEPEKAYAISILLAGRNLEAPTE